MAAFSPNPLSLSFSNQDINQWVREGEALERQRVADETRRKEGLGAGGAGGHSGGSGKHGALGNAKPRFKTPYLTVSDLKKPAKGWREFFAADFFWRSYKVPRTLTELKLTLDGNVFEFFGNYVTLAFVFLCCVLYNKPKALLGGYLLIKLWAWVRSFDESPDSFSYKTRNLSATLISWLVGKGLSRSPRPASLNAHTRPDKGTVITSDCLRNTRGPRD